MSKIGGHAISVHKYKTLLEDQLITQRNKKSIFSLYNFVCKSTTNFWIMQLYYNFFLNTQAFPSYSQTTTIFDIHPTKKAVTRLKSFCFAHQCSFCIPLSKNKRVTSIFEYFCSEWNEAYFCYIKKAVTRLNLSS